MTMQRNFLGYNFCVFALVFLALWQNGSCKSDKTDPMSTIKQNRVANGNWGGQNVGMEVTADGARLRFSCANGSITKPLMLDAQGRFSVPGMFVAESPGPRNEDNPPKDQPALYSGSVQGESMTLTITLTATNEKVGTFSLEHGKGGQVRRCH
jgi:hypothetical protein